MGLRLQKYGTGSSVVSRRWIDKPVRICCATTVVSSAWGVGDLKDGTRHALGQRIQLIGVYRRSSAAKPECRPNAQALKNDSLAADQRRSTPILAGTAGLGFQVSLLSCAQAGRQAVNRADQIGNGIHRRRLTP